MRSDEECIFDVVVVGGGAAGVAAACGAARQGAKVALFEQYGFLGGAATNSSVLAYCGFFTKSKEQVVKGIGQDFLDVLDQQDLYLTETFENTGNTVVLLDRETTKRSLDQLLKDAGVTVFHHAVVFNASSDTTSQRINSVQISHRGGILTCYAKQFVDASGDGVLADRCGARFLTSDVDKRQASTLVMHVGGVAEGAEPTQEQMRVAVEKYNAKYETNLSISNGTCVRSPLTRELMLLVADEFRDVLKIDELSAAEIEARSNANKYFKAFKDYLPGFESSWLSHTGPQIGIRESRRIEGIETITGEHAINAKQQPEFAIARSGWPIEDHSSRGETNYSDIGGTGWYHIHLGSIASRNIDNLWMAGRLVSSDSRAFASVRVMGTAFATGHAAGVAAAIAQNEQGRERLGLIADIQEELRKQGALI